MSRADLASGEMQAVLSGSMARARPGPGRPYHHGNVRAEVLAAALDAIAENGAASVSLRDLARRVGITHGAASHHFGDKAGVLRAVAAEGYGLLADDLERAAAAGDFGDVGVAYVRFAVHHPAHFEVMFRPELYRPDDEQVMEAKTRSAAALYESARQVADAAGGDHHRAGVAGWALVHGIATLWREGNLPPDLRDPVALAEQIGPYLFQSSKAARQRKRSPHRAV